MTRRVGFVLPVLGLVLVLSGCLWNTTLVKVKTDGSGAVVETTIMRAQAVAMFRQMAAGFGPADPDAPPKQVELFKESDAKAKAATMGEGVTFVSAEKIKNAEGEGQKATYAFTDISKLRLTQRPEGPKSPGPGLSAGPAGQEDPLTFRTSKLDNGNTLLTIAFPKGKPADAAGGQAKPKPMPPQQMAMMKQMLKGMKISIVVEVEGKLVKTSSPYVEGSKVTLLEVDMDALLADEAKFQELATRNPQSPEEMKEVLKGVKGCKFVPEPEVTIEFK